MGFIDGIGQGCGCVFGVKIAILIILAVIFS